MPVAGVTLVHLFDQRDEDVAPTAVVVRVDVVGVVGPRFVGQAAQLCGVCFVEEGEVSVDGLGGVGLVRGGHCLVPPDLL
jgi:hypothetical protein